MQAELLDRLAKEKPKDALDLRNRLDSQGKRYGRVIQFRCRDHACIQQNSACPAHNTPALMDPDLSPQHTIPQH